MSRNATAGLDFARKGSGFPCAVTPCQIRIAMTEIMATESNT